MESAIQSIPISSGAMGTIQYSEDSFTTSFLSDQPRENAISVKGVYKRYKKHIILSNFNMEVPEGCIYGLLGSSGCGKTTLLNCMMGISEIDIGEINVKYKTLSDVGLMPQNNGLIPSLTITETLNYFGKIFGMSNHQISSRTEELTKLLQLPSQSLKTDYLSGGQQRRVSLAVAFLHNPKLLLLDEPTVGLDPLLCQTIWDYLVSITNEQGKTVVITTHYIEEAKQAHMVGLMRQGKLIETGPPTQLMEKHFCSTLEEAFLKLSKKDDKMKLTWPSQSINPPVQVTFNRNDKFSFVRFNAQVYKNTLFILRDIVCMIILFAIPLLQTNIQHWALGRDPASVSLAVVNNDVNNCSVYNCFRECSADGLSCCYLENLRQLNEIHLIHSDDLKEAKQLAEKNEVWGIIHFPDNFSTILSSRSASYFTQGLANDTIESGQVQVYLDTTDVILEVFVKRKLMRIFFDFLGKLYTACGWERKAASLPLRLEEPVYGSKDPVFTHYQTAPLIMCACFASPMLLTPLCILEEKLSGFLQRSLSSGLTIIELLSALFFIQIFLLFVQISIFFVILYAIYGHPFVTDVWLPFSICMYEGVSGIIFGILLSFISNSYIMASLAGSGIFFMMTFTNGCLWPLEGVHSALRVFFWSSPLALASDAFRSMTTRGWTFLHPKVYPGFISISVWTLLYIVVILMIGLKNGMIVKK